MYLCFIFSPFCRLAAVFVLYFRSFIIFLNKTLSMLSVIDRWFIILFFSLVVEALFGRPYDIPNRLFSPLFFFWNSFTVFGTSFFSSYFSYIPFPPFCWCQRIIWYVNWLLYEGIFTSIMPKSSISDFSREYFKFLSLQFVTGLQNF